MTNSHQEYDFVLVGGGLQAGLLALAIDHHNPTANVLILEKNKCLFGNHTWSFHRSDISCEWSWISQLSITQWPGYTVHFPGINRIVELPYCSVSSDQFRKTIKRLSINSDRLRVQTEAEVNEVETHCVRTSKGEFLGKTIVDCRGKTTGGLSGVGYQKFLGLELILDEDWPDLLPTIMEANLDQNDGYRFLYVLPFEPRRILIEDTFFSESSLIDQDQSAKAIESYLKDRRVSRWQVIRREQGCLPMPFTSTCQPVTSNQLTGGYAGGWFHAATGFSFALAARFADVVASSESDLIGQNVSRLAEKNRFQRTFARFLNRLLFHLVPPSCRHEIFRRFYTKLPDDAIQRFYAHAFTKTDAVRILFGLPPSSLTPIKFFQSFKAAICRA